MNFVPHIKKCHSWFENNSTNDYVYTTNISRIPYHEVSGYFIPTLMDFGFRDRAISFSEYLVSVQNGDGSWNPHGNFGDDRKSYLFDTAQVVDGLTEFGNKYKCNIDKASKWIIDHSENNRFQNMYIHPDVKNHYYMRVLYCLKKAGIDVSELCRSYSEDPSIYEFDVLSHFYGYAFEGCARMGMNCSKFIKTVEGYNGLIPERLGSNAYCFVGLCQISLSMFLCGRDKIGMKILEFVSGFQKENGGFCGSNGKYFPDAEISWGVKFYMDAFSHAQKSWFKNNVHIFADAFERGDSDLRYIFVKSNVRENDKVLEVGCGKGRYINRLNCDRYACDVADSSKYVNAKFSMGSCLLLPYEDNSFDVVFCAEVLEHAIFHDNAIKECLRVTKKGGRVLIIDKDSKIKFDELHFGEEWLDFSLIKSRYNAEITEINNDSLAYPFFTAKIIKL